MIALRRLVRGELLKLRTTRTAAALAGSGAAVSVGLVCVRLASSSKDELDGAHGLREVLSLAGVGAGLAALALGVVTMTAEYRHGTIWQTFLAAPARSAVVAAKALTCAVAGVAVGLPAVASAYLVAALWLDSRGAGFSAGDALPLEIAGGALAACALLGAAGAALGALLRDQRVALAAGIGWMVAVDGVATRALPEVGRFLPGGGQAALLRQPEEELLSMAAGGLLLLGYTAVLVALALRVTGRRDVV